VSFSQHASSNETKAFDLLQGDFAIMTSLCSRFEGSVLENSGSGLLMSFQSAVQAVQCALQIQLELDEKSLSGAEAEPFAHRMGVHLGGMYMQDGHVLGDGVDVASGLQAEALPGGIYLSQTVYEVVRAKVALNAVFMGPRRLKQIVSSVPAWQIPPLGASIDMFFEALEPKSVPVEGSGTCRHKAMPVVAGGAVVAAVMLVLFGIGAPSPSVASSEKSWAEMVVPDAPQIVPQEPTKRKPGPTRPGSVSEGFQVPDDPSIHDGKPAMANLISWLSTQLKEVGDTDPIVVPPPRWAALPEMRVWSDGPNRVVILRGDTREIRSLQDLAPLEVAAIANAVLRRAGIRDPDSRKVAQFLSEVGMPHGLKAKGP
jgi:hypothetical protein